MDGITAVKNIRQGEQDNPTWERQLVIALTGNARQGQIDHAQQSGMDDGECSILVSLHERSSDFDKVMIKPYKLPVLLVKVKAAIEARPGAAPRSVNGIRGGA